MKKRSINHSISYSFIIILFIVSINQIFGFINKNDSSENRQLNKKPKLDINRLDFFPNEYDKYLNDNFNLRAYFIDFYRWQNKYIFHRKTLNNKYILGKDNYIFELTKNLPLYTGKRTVSTDEIKRITKEFNCRNEYFKSIGVKMCILVIPSKYAVYSNKLPKLLSKGSKHMGELFIQELTKNTDITIIDGTKELNKHSKKEHVYFKYDTHWNKLGSFYAYQTVVDSLQNSFENIIDIDTSLFSIVAFEKNDGNLKQVALNKNDPDFGYEIIPKTKTFKEIKAYQHIAPKDFRYGQNAYCIRFISANRNAPKAVIIRDSYANLTTSYLPEIFSETLYIWDDWKYTFNKDIIDLEKPDLLIYAIYEGYIDRILMAPSFVASIKQDSNLQ